MNCFTKKTFACLSAATILTGMLAGCGTQLQNSSGASSSSSESVVSNASPLTEYSSEDLDASWEEASAVSVSLDGDSFTVNGEGASTDGSVLTISAAGTYVLSGTMTDGQVLVKAGKNDLVRLVLNGVTISCSDSAPFYFGQSEKVILTLAPGTENTVSDSPDYQYPDETTDEPNAAIFGKDDITINGDGSLDVTGNYENAVASKDDLVITGGTIKATAAKDGLRGRDSVSILAGNFTIDAQADGIQSNNDEDPEKGTVSIDGGTFAITSGNDAIQAESTLQVTGGEFDLVTGGGSANAKSDDPRDGFPGQMRASADSENPPEDIPSDRTAPPQEMQPVTTAGTTINPSDRDEKAMPQMQASDSSEESAESTKGLKAGGEVVITGGQFTIDACDDAVHANGDVSIQGGTFQLASGDDAVHADAALTVSGGELNITNCYEGLEGQSITISGGFVQLTAKDDGINASSAETSSQKGGPDSADETCYIQISGGTVLVDAAGDGIDSNGNLYFEGGMALVNGPVNDGNGSLDYNGSCEITGGVLIASGSSGMAQAPGESSSQNTLMVTYSSAQAAGTLVSLADENGNPVVTFAPSKEYRSIVISSPALEQGKTYTLFSGGSCTGEQTGGLYESDAAYSGGTKLTDVTLSGAVTRIADDGSTTAANEMRPGGMGGRGGFGQPGGRTPPSQNDAASPTEAGNTSGQNS